MQGDRVQWIGLECRVGVEMKLIIHLLPLAKADIPAIESAYMIMHLILWDTVQNMPDAVVESMIEHRPALLVTLHAGVKRECPPVIDLVLKIPIPHKLLVSNEREAAHSEMHTVVLLGNTNKIAALVDIDCAIETISRIATFVASSQSQTPLHL